ncbi:MAG: xanthine dehydrogenase family protein molybdopterin-binding subunit [Desulfobacteraceae bacterium]
MKKNNVYYLKDISPPETPEPGERPSTWKKTAVIGKRLPRVDAYERTSGSALYPSDLLLPHMAYGAILRCPHPHAKVKRVDTRPAENLKGVLCVITGNTPEADIWWRNEDGYRSKLFDPHCRFEGETVAAVAAKDPYTARDAVQAIRVEYEVLPFVSEKKRALAKDAPRVHADGNLAGTETYERGDVDQGFAKADVVLERTFDTRCEIHTPMELHSCVAEWKGNSLHLYESTQGVYAVQAKVADALQLPLSRVRVSGRYMGGGFGSKLKAGKYTVISAILARKTARPVKLVLTREETYLAVGNRPSSHMTLKAGVKKDGTLTALQFTCTGTGGAYPAGGVALVDWLIRDLYTCPSVKTECRDVFINAGPARPFRAPGHPQGSWALEQMMDELAETLHMDPVDLRLKNIPTVSQGRTGQPAYTSTGLKECIESGAQSFGWKAARQRNKSSNTGTLRRGVGMGGCVWFVGGGGPPSTVILKLFKDGSVNLNMGASDIGTGTKTVMAMVVAEELGVKLKNIQIENADTGTTQYATPSGGSKTVPTESPAVRNAAIHIKQKLMEMAAEELDCDFEDLEFEGDEIIVSSRKERRIKITDIPKLKKQGVIVGVGYRGPNPENKSVNPFGAQFCEVEVNTRTGEVRILRFLGAHDSGRVMNRLTYDNQVFGGITMGIGFALTEFRVLDTGQTGKMVNRNWHDYKLPTALDVPVDMKSLPIELDDREANNTGAKGLGEPVTIPTAAAIADAIYDATGIRITETPAFVPHLITRLNDLAKEG